MATPQKFTINTPLINYFLYKEGPQINTPLVAGTIDFFRADDHSQRADTYSDVSDPNNPVVNSNPIVLDANGACPVIYLKDIPYFIIIKSAEGQTVITYTNYRGATFAQDSNVTGSSTSNLLSNGQYSYPIQFNQIGQSPGQITEGNTNVAFGWYFAQDFGSEANNVTFPDISNQLIEGSPQFECVVTSASSLSNTVKYLAGIYGSVTAFEGSEITFSVQLMNKAFSGEIPVSITIEKNYGNGGSPTEIISITNFIATPTRTKFKIIFQNPPSVSRVIGPGNYAALRINFPLNQSFSVGQTNCLMQLGSIDNPVYIGQDFSSEVSQLLGGSTEVENSGLYQNYSPMTYSDGLFFPSDNAGQITLSAAGIDFPDKLEVEGQAIPLSGYSEKNIPFRRLFDVIGTTYGASSGTVSVTSSNNVITFISTIGGIQNSAYTNGNIGPGYVVANTVPGLRYGFNLEVDSSNNTQVVMTWTEKFAINVTANPILPGPQIGAIGNNYFSTGRYNNPNPRTWGSQVITVVTIDAGSPTVNPVARIHFDGANINAYATYNQLWSSDAYLLYSSANMLEFCIDSAHNGTRGAYTSQYNPPSPDRSFSPGCLRFQVNGAFGPIPFFEPIGTFHTITFNMLTSESLSQNVARFVREVANAFQWTITVNSFPSASQYFLFSDLTTDNYGWYRVNGAGTDPAVPSRTGFMIDILSTDTLEQIAEKTAIALTSTFNLPTPGVNLPALPDDSKSSYYINL